MSIKTYYYADEPADLDGHMTIAQELAFRGTFPETCCPECRWWEEYEPPLFSGDCSVKYDKAVPVYDGLCKRHSPVILIPTPGNQEPAVSFWPETSYRDWCGDFKP